MLNVNNDPYIEARDGNYYVGKTRVTLITIVGAWKQGETPERIHSDFSTVPLASVYGTIAYYLAHQDAVDVYMTEIHENALRLRAEAEAADPERYARLRARLAETRERLRQELPLREEHGYSLNPSQNNG